jgi:hypothetical protein
MASRWQRMNLSFNRLHLVNSYGAFGSVTRVRNEVIIEGTDAVSIDSDTTWHAYEFKGKPGDLRRRPPQVAPYHLRLDWLMWFAALSSAYAEGWFAALAIKLLQGDRATLRLLRSNPFPDAPPRFVRARLYRYRFTTPQERHDTGAWWARELVGEYMPAIALDSAGAKDYRAPRRAQVQERPARRLPRTRPSAAPGRRGGWHGPLHGAGRLYESILADPAREPTRPPRAGPAAGPGAGRQDQPDLLQLR